MCHKQQGIVLCIVLIVSMILSWLMVEMLQSGADSMQMAAHAQQRQILLQSAQVLLAQGEAAWMSSCTYIQPQHWSFAQQSSGWWQAHRCQGKSMVIEHLSHTHCKQAEIDYYRITARATNAGMDVILQSSIAVADHRQQACMALGRLSWRQLR